MFCACATGSCATVSRGFFLTVVQVPWIPKATRRVCACATESGATVSRVFFLTVVQVPWIPKVTRRVCACSTGSCATVSRFFPYSNTSTMDTEGCAHAQPEIAQPFPALFSYYGTSTMDTCDRRVCATGCWPPEVRVSRAFFLVLLLGCSLRRPRPIVSMVTGTSYLPLSRHFIFISLVIYPFPVILFSYSVYVV